MNGHDLYKAPQADLRQTSVSTDFPIEVYSHLASAGIWARLTAILFFIQMFFTAISIVTAIASPNKNSIWVGSVIGWLIALVLFFYLGGAMNRYAKAAKRIKNGEMTEAEVLDCFEATTRFSKIQVILMIIMTVSVVLQMIYSTYAFSNML